MMTRLCHEILAFYFKRKATALNQAAENIEAAQRSKLSQIMQSLSESERWKAYANKSYEELSQLIPISTYSEFRNDIDEQRSKGRNILSSSIVRYEPTSGSTEQRKWIPYTQAFLAEINEAAGAWLGDLYQRLPKIKEGAHYWSLSWLPKELRGLTSSNDADLFPAYQRLILQKSMAVPAEISQVEEPEAAWWATLVYLCARKDLTLVSVWSPTFWIKVTEDIRTQWTDIVSCLSEDHWGKYDKDLREVLGAPPRRDLKNIDIGDNNFFKKLWPKLTLISSWDSSSSTLWSEQIKAQFPWVSFQGKGLWATEGVVSIPFKGQKVLSVNSHFYEFKDLQSGNVVPSWSLQQGREYQPIVWSSSGLLRYILQDRVKITNFFGQIPCLEFLGRLQSVDMVGEKMDTAWVQDLFGRNPQWKALCLIASRQPHPHYVLCHQGDLKIDIESELLKLHHYKVARELGQLGPARTFLVKDLFTFFEQTGKSRLVGQNKIEVLLELENFNL